MVPSSQGEAAGPGAAPAGELKLGYAACEALVAVCAILGNGLVILVFAKERKLRRRTNYYIISLACADLLVGLFAIPFAVLASIGLPRNLHACLFTVSVLVVLCTISIFCLVAVSVDRYWAILHPMGYSRTVRTKTAIGIICVCWLAGTLLGFLPLLGWNAGHKSDAKCIFVEVMDYDYLVFLYFATIILPALLIAAFYAHIYRVVIKQLQQIVTMNPGCKRKENETHGTMLRLLGAAQKREVKATQNLSRIVLFFIICWFPLYTINCVVAFCPQCRVNEVLLNFCIILSHLNSAGNPLLYAYHLKDFRAALKSFIHGLLFPAAFASTTTSRPRSLVAGAGARARPLQPSLVLATSRLHSGQAALSEGSGSGRSKPASISIVAAAINGTSNNNNNDDDANVIKINSNNRKRKLPLSSPVSILGCSRRDTASSSGSSPNASPGRATRPGSNEAEAATCNTSASSVLPATLELRTYEFEAALQFVDCDCDDDEDDDADARRIMSRQRLTLVVEADVNRSVAAADTDLLEQPSDKRNFDQVPAQ